MMFDHPTNNSSFEEPYKTMPQNILPQSTRAPPVSNSVASGGNNDLLKKYKVKLHK